MDVNVKSALEIYIMMIGLYFKGTTFMSLSLLHVIRVGQGDDSILNLEYKSQVPTSMINRQLTGILIALQSWMGHKRDIQLHINAHYTMTIYGFRNLS